MGSSGKSVGWVAPRSTPPSGDSIRRRADIFYQSFTTGRSLSSRIYMPQQRNSPPGAFVDRVLSRGSGSAMVVHTLGWQENPAPWLLTPAALTAMNGAPGQQDWLALRIRDWLSLLLCFAITRDPEDEAAALSMAADIDSLGSRWGSSLPTFFRRTNNEVCSAICCSDDPEREIVLKRHLARIDDLRLRRAFRAAVDLERRLSLARS